MIDQRSVILVLTPLIRDYLSHLHESVEKIGNITNNQTNYVVFAY